MSFCYFIKKASSTHTNKQNLTVLISWWDAFSLTQSFCSFSLSLSLEFSLTHTHSLSFSHKRTMLLPLIRLNLYPCFSCYLFLNIASWLLLISVSSLSIYISVFVFFRSTVSYFSFYVYVSQKTPLRALVVTYSDFEATNTFLNPVSFFFTKKWKVVKAHNA